MQELEQFHGPVAGFLLSGACNKGGYAEVFESGEFRQKVMKLEYNTYVTVAERGQPLFVEGGNILVVEKDRS